MSATDGPESNVIKLYIYDLSRGLAAQLSPALLGKQIDGIWHTGIVVYGLEYFFGGLGIEYCSPGCTVVGSPTRVVDLGETHVPKDVFMDYLFELSSEYLPEKYNLVEHNCNNFTNDVSQFLTGNPIPSYITGLPKEILDTPIGAQLRPLLEVMGGPNGGTPIGQDPQGPTRS